MTDRESFLVRKFRKRTVQRRIKKQWIVAEAARASRRSENAAVHRAFHRFEQPTRLGHGQNADIACTSILAPGQIRQEQCVVRCVGGARTRVAGRIDPRRAVQCVYNEP